MSNSLNSNGENSTKKDGFFLDTGPYLVTNLSFTRSEAFVGILLAAAAPKGKISGDEIIELYRFLIGTKTLMDYSISEVNAMLKKVQAHMEELGFDSLVDHAIAFYAHKSNRKIYKDACKVVYIIKKASHEEEKILDELQRCMGLNWLKTMKIRKKVKLKARG